MGRPKQAVTLEARTIRLTPAEWEAVKASGLSAADVLRCGLLHGEQSAEVSGAGNDGLSGAEKPALEFRGAETLVDLAPLRAQLERVTAERDALRAAAEPPPAAVRILPVRSIQTVTGARGITEFLVPLPTPTVRSTFPFSKLDQTGKTPKGMRGTVERAAVETE